MTKQTLQIHSENILPIIKRWLYSDKDIFVRELVSNACDAIQKVKILRDQGLVEARDEDFKIEIQINKTEHTLKFIDNGIGMDADEVQKYIAQIAFSGAEEFVNKYKTNNERDQFIGHFGLGFYSAYMVAQKVEINTLSYKAGASPVFWSCDGSSEYLLEKGSRESRGTEITLFIDKESEEYLEESRLKEILKHYCSFLPYPVYLGSTLINTQPPLWIKPVSECTEKDYLEFYRYLYPMEEDPLFWVHLNVDYPFHLKGILYFPKIRRDFDLQKSTVKLYCNRVFVSDNCKDVIPNYLMVLRGVIDSPDIPLNVSRSYLQMDRTVRQLASHISKKVSDSLGSLYRNEHERFINCWDDVSMVVKLGILEDEKFYDRVKDCLIWKVVEGSWTTAEEYLERNREKTKDKIFYTKDPSHASHFLEVYRKQGVEVISAESPVDSYVMQFLEQKLPSCSFQRIDASIDDNIIDKSKEKSILDASGKTEASHLADFIRSKLSDEKINVEAKSLATESLPGFVVLDESQRRMRDYFRHLDPKEAAGKMHLMPSYTFVVNTNNPLMAAIEKIDALDPDLAKDIVKQTFELSLISQREIDPASLNEFVSRNMRVLENSPIWQAIITNRINMLNIFYIRVLALLVLFLGNTSFNLAAATEPVALYLTWRHHPESTMLVCWITTPNNPEDSLEYQAQGSSTWSPANGSHTQLPGDTAYLLHSVELTQLSPSTNYFFRLSQESSAYKFQTMPLSLNQETIRFVAGGDMYHDGLDILQETNRQAASTAPHFALVGGDIAYATGRMAGFLPRWTNAWIDQLLGQKMERWLTWLIAWQNDMVTPDGRLVPILPALGNHDVSGGFAQTPAQAAFFYALFPMPGPQGYNVLDFGNYMSIFLLDSGHTHPIEGQQANWLSTALEQRMTIPHKFALYHVPAFPSVRSFKEEISRKIRKYWVPFFDKFRLTAAFENHEHAYKRTFPLLNGKIDPAGVLYFGDGAWGVEHPRQPHHLSKKWYLARAEAARHFFLINVQSNKRHVAAITSDGRLIDEVSW